MNINDPVENLWLGKIQMEMGVYVTNGLLAEARIESLNHALTKALAENEGLKLQVQDMGQANAALKAEVARLMALVKPVLKKKGGQSDG